MNVYPSIEELTPRVIKSYIPELLMQEIKERYETLGEKYLTEQTTEDGRRINAMMFTDRIVNCREELIDAAFCVIGQIYKEAINGNQPDDAFYALLEGCIDMYSLCVALEESESYVVG